MLYYLCPKATYLDVSSSHVAAQAQSRSALLKENKARPWSESEPWFPTMGAHPQNRGAQRQVEPPLCLGIVGGKGVTEHGTLTWSWAEGLAVPSLSTETRRGCRLWNSSSLLGPGPS